MARLGFRVFRVRHHGSLARLEVGRGELSRALDMEMADRLHAALRSAGYQYVALDLAGYRQGSLNEVLGQRPEGTFPILG